MRGSAGFLLVLVGIVLCSVHGRSLEEIRKSYLDLEHEVYDETGIFRYVVKGGGWTERNLSLPLSFESRRFDAATLKGGATAKRWSSFFSAEKIVNGDVVDKVGEYPQVVALLNVRGGIFRLPFCTGVILDSNIVMSAAHCDFGAQLAREFTVLACAAVVDASNPEFISDENCREMTEFFIPRQYVMDREDLEQGYDLALLRLERPFVFSDSIKRIKYSRIPALQGMIARGVGYGRSTTRLSTDGLLREVDTEIVMNGGCKSLIETRDEDDLNLQCSDGNFDGSKGTTCQGDSGGSLIIADGSVDDFYTVGVLSYGTVEVVSDEELRKLQIPGLHPACPLLWPPVSLFPFQFVCLLFRNELHGFTQADNLRF